MNIKTYISHRLIKSEDLNHHGTLFAGRSAEWFVESAFIAGSSLVNAKNLVCVKINGMHFKKPVQLGDILFYESKIVFAGRTSLVAHVAASLRDNPDDTLVEGLISFVHVDHQTKPVPHNITIEAETAEDIKLQKQAAFLKN
ncbi:MAG: hypothetical protein K9L30_12480 [Desulfobacterales bacterium]|nr:hypothetical protein [Desulfobacterales bacterium]